MENFKVLIIGDAIGEPGLEQIKAKLKKTIEDTEASLVIVNGENLDGGAGITEEDYNALLEEGTTVVTSGNHIWSNEDASFLLKKYDNLLRPSNYYNAPGKGWWKKNINGVEVAVVNLIGRYSMTPVDCPFQTLEKLLETELAESKIIIVDFHAELMNEKKALAIDFDGRISFLAGTHTHVQTADEIIFQKGTGYITDIGMTGGLDSVIGMEHRAILQKIKRQINQPYIPSTENEKLQGVVVEIDKETGKTLNIKRISY